jgi:hypothetical protein
VIVIGSAIAYHEGGKFVDKEEMLLGKEEERFVGI